MANLSSSLDGQRSRLIEALRGYKSCAVAFSGGVDSAVVAQAAQIALGNKAVAVTGVSASLAEGELEAARALAAQIGIRHETILTDELSDTAYVQNAADRCYHCKTHLYDLMVAALPRLGVAIVAAGANTDDEGDYRPGMQAATEHQVRSPLLECELGKSDVRALAQHWGLSVWDKPATPCLSSRIAYGEEVTPERLRMIDAAERFLRDAGLTSGRVRYHRGDLARVEVSPEALSKLCEGDLREQLLSKLRSLGFKYITLDLAGFRSGSQNDVLPLDVLQKPVEQA